MAKTKTPKQNRNPPNVGDKPDGFSFEIQTPKVMGRPPTQMEVLEANKPQFEKLMEKFMNLEWMADFYQVSADTVSRFVKKHWNCTFAELRNKKMLPLRASLNNAMFEEAVVKRNHIMMIYVSKNINKWQNNPEPSPEQQDDIELEFVDPSEPPSETKDPI